MDIRPGSQMDHIVKCINGRFANEVFSTDDISSFLYDKYGYSGDSIKSEVTKLYNDSDILIRRSYYKKKKSIKGLKVFHYLYCTKDNFKLFEKVKLEKANRDGQIVHIKLKKGLRPKTIKTGSQMFHIIKCIQGPFAKKVFSTDDIANFLHREQGFSKESTAGLVAKYHKISPPGTLLRRAYYKKKDTVDFPIFHFLYCTKGNSKLFKNVELEKAKGGGNRW
jgi:hypothetical protein